MGADVHNVSTYTNHKCRCDQCRSAWRIYIAGRKAQRYAWVKVNGLPPSVRHGESAYTNWGCRCESCKTSWNAAQRERYARSREGLS